ncbi:MAG: hypothetical protein KKC76_12085 [Proteobacteria bacterium]|nr:hypothetical protein [Pseudomonadota bacterium]MBU4295279.1 hypothetical protein [Pseudomonadota bacterium]MCG2748134.1 hypothetical protein [Desulfobulbaceae bacterium]
MRIWHHDVLMTEKARPGMLLFKFSGHLLLCLLTIGIMLFAPLNSRVYAEGNAIDVCRTITGVEVAKTIDGKIMETKSLDVGINSQW